MAAFACVSLIGFVAAILVLPILHVRAQNREINSSREHNVKVLRNRFVTAIKEARGRVDVVGHTREAAKRLEETPGLDLERWDKTQSISVQETGSELQTFSVDSASFEIEANLREAMEESRFRIASIVPKDLSSLENRITVIRSKEDGDLYLPIMTRLTLPGFDGTLAMANHSVEPLPFHPEPENESEQDDLFSYLTKAGLRSASDVFYYPASMLREYKPVLFGDIDNQKVEPYLERRGENRTQRLLFVPVVGLDRNFELIGAYCIVYPPPAGLVAWQELASGPAYLAVGLAALLAILFSYFFAKGITRPVQSLTEGALAIAEGKLDKQVEVRSKDEIGVLADTFNGMTARLRFTLDQLRERADTIENQNLELDNRFSQLNALQAYTENVLKSVDSAIFTIDLQERIQRPNRAARDLLGLEDDQSLEQFEGRSLRERLLSALEEGEGSVADEISVVTSEGETIPVALSVSPLREGDAITGAVAVVTDLQRIKSLERLVSRQERLAALGQLTAGVAHEIRNPLSTIKACAEILGQRFAGEAGEEGLCDDIIEEVDRLSRVVSNFLFFARPAEPDRGPVDLNALIEETLGRVERGEGGGVVLEKRFENGPVFADADAGQVEQVLLNLVRNGIEAGGGKGNLEIRTGLADNGEGAWFEVSDDGEGMSEEVRGRIFDPFFTCKEEGTGLGLSICHSILASHGGTIEVVESSPGGGTVFRVGFPAFKEEVDNEAV